MGASQDDFVWLFEVVFLRQAAIKLWGQIVGFATRAHTAMANS